MAITFQINTVNIICIFICGLYMVHQLTLILDKAKGNTKGNQRWKKMTSCSLPIFSGHHIFIFIYNEEKKIWWKDKISTSINLLLLLLVKPELIYWLVRWMCNWQPFTFHQLFLSSLSSSGSFIFRHSFYSPFETIIDHHQCLTLSYLKLWPLWMVNIDHREIRFT